MNNSLDNNHVLKAYSLAKNSLGEKLTGSKIAKEIKSKNLAWVHLDGSHEEAEKWLTSECEYLDSIIINGLLAEETRPRIEEINDGLFLILRCVNLSKNSDPEDMISIRMWVDPCRIITVQKRDTKSINDVEKSVISNLAPQNSGDFLCLLLSAIFKRMEPILGSLDEVMDDVEEELIENPNTDLRAKLTKIRKQAIIFRRYMMPQRDLLGRLKSTNLKWLSDLHKRHLQEHYNHNMRYVEDLEAVRERAQIVKDELSNLLSDKINKNMYILSVIAAIFLPLGLLTGLLGINVGGIPGSDNPYGFYIVSGSLAFLVICQVFLFKKLKWF
jgi:zinc transporter